MNVYVSVSHMSALKSLMAILAVFAVKAGFAVALENEENLGRDPKKSYNFFCESGYFVNYCSLVVCKISSAP